MIYYIDIDGTICYTEGIDYDNSKPDLEKIKQVNELYDKGHEIHYWSSRGGMSGKDWYLFTVAQLNEWGCKFTSIKLGKPVYDKWVYDKAIKEKDFFNG